MPRTSPCRRDGMGRAIAAAFYEPYAVKLWGVPANDLSGELFRRRVGVRARRGSSARRCAAVTRRRSGIPLVASGGSSRRWPRP